jgi:hypothetical protein
VRSASCSTRWACRRPPDDGALAIRVIELEHTVTALVLEAVETLAKTFSVDQDVRACSLCGRSRWVLSLRM